MNNENCKRKLGRQRVGGDIAERLLEFAVRIGKVVDALPDTRLGRPIAGQLIRCGTSPAPNYAEACGAKSKRDFIHKLGISLKELCELPAGSRSSFDRKCCQRRGSQFCWANASSCATSLPS